MDEIFNFDKRAVGRKLQTALCRGRNLREYYYIVNLDAFHLHTVQQMKIWVPRQISNRYDNLDPFYNGDSELEAINLPSLIKPYHLKQITTVS